MLAEIITIGDEILIGQIVDTNSAWMARELNAAGIRIKQISSVSDDAEHIINALNEAQQRADMILITGGLGPTKDDITKKTLARYFSVEMVENEDALNNVKRIFARYNRPLLDVNKKQAEVPANCEVIQNKNGTAPGMWFHEHGKVFVSMPGVPSEMMYMMEDAVIPKLKETFQLPFIYHKTILTVGEGESFLAERIAGIEDALPSYIKLAYLPKQGSVRLRLSGYGEDKQQITTEVEHYASLIVDKVRNVVAAEQDVALEKAILDKMAARNLKLSIAESCTGGYLCHLFTQHAGSSAVFLGGAVSYADQLKEAILNVNSETLWQYGAVSEQTVNEMADGALKNFGSDYAIAITGIAGPGGGSDEKPVGTVWVAIVGNGNRLVRKFSFGNKRTQNIERAATAALGMLNTLLSDNIN